MSRSNDDLYRRRIAELEEEVARLQKSLDTVKADRKALREELYGPVREDELTTEAEMIEIMKAHVPGSGPKFFAELGLLPDRPA
jgi:hypothetical protein